MVFFIVFYEYTRCNNSLCSLICFLCLFDTAFLMNYSSFIWWNGQKDVSLQLEKLYLRSENISLAFVNTRSWSVNISLLCVNIKYVEQK